MAAIANRAKTLIKRVQDFWLAGANAATPLASSVSSRWFGGGAEFDALIRKEFESDLLEVHPLPSLTAADSDSTGAAPAPSALSKELDQSAEGVLTKVILMDQFSRNIYRSTPRMYAFDQSAQQLVTTIAFPKTYDLSLDPFQSVWLYMPLMHAESKTLQQLSITKFEALNQRVLSSKSPNAGFFTANLKYAYSHAADIARYGRFPYRNAVLGRPSTADGTYGCLSVPLIQDQDCL